MKVITYSYAYLRGSITLCAQHAKTPPDWVPSLGPVERGEHRGRCDACDASVAVGRRAILEAEEQGQ